MIRWEEPPETGTSSRPGAWTEEAAELRENPSRWAVIAEYSEDQKVKAYDLVGMIKRGKAVAFRPSGSFDAVTRRSPDGTQVVYAMYAGEEDQENEKEEHDNTEV